jgi:acyl carrier protein
MKREDIESKLQGLVVSELLEGKGEGIAPSTPLLELGLINSLSIMMVVRFIEEQFEVSVPSELLTPENLRSISSMADMVLRLSEKR